MMLALAAGQLRAETETNMPYVIYDSGSTTLYFLCNTGDPLAVEGTVTVDENTTITIADGCLWKDKAVTDTRTSLPPGWNSKCSKATKVVFKPSFANAKVKSCYKWFNDFRGLTTVTGLEYLKTSSETSMANMFSSCRALTSLDLSKFDTSNVTNMSNMFSGCTSLTSLDLSKFDTSDVIHMSGMFSDCSSLKSLVFGQLDTSNVRDMDNMFNYCNILQFLDLSKATGDKIPDMIGTLPNYLPYDPLIFVPAGITLEGRKNVISPNGGKCDNLEINAYSLTSLSFPYSFKANNITVSRKFVAGQPHTLYLPFALPNDNTLGIFYTFQEYKDNKVIFEKLTADKTTTAANTPYLFVPNEATANSNQIVIDGENIEVKATTDATQPEMGLIGVYKKHTFDDTNKANCYGWADDKFMKAGSGASVGACRAYLKLAADGGSLAPARLSIQLGDGTTGITAVKGGADGDSDAPMYNLQGQRVDKSYRGVVIKNGKKMIIK